MKAAYSALLCQPLSKNEFCISTGWDDIGYSFLVGDDGNIYEARGWDRVGAHTLGWNDKSKSIAVMGNFNYDLPSLLALKAINRLISCGVHQEKVLPNYNLYCTEMLHHILIVLGISCTI